MKKYFVIGNPINHSLSPKLHNYWLRENSIDAIYDKKKIDEKNLQSIISEIKEKCFFTFGNIHTKQTCGFLLENLSIQASFGKKRVKKKKMKQSMSPSCPFS